MDPLRAALLVDFLLQSEATEPRGPLPLCVPQGRVAEVEPPRIPAVIPEADGMG